MTTEPMNYMRLFFQPFFMRMSRIGLYEKVPDEEVRIILIHNSLNTLSSLFLAPFPLLFYILDLPHGYILCLLSMVAIGVQYFLNYLQFFTLSRFLGIMLGIQAFALGVIFYGYNAGFIYGIMALFPLPILYFRKNRYRIGAIALNSLIVIGIIYFFRNLIPLFEVPQNIYLVNACLLFFCTLLVISYFLSSDWINQIYRHRNAQLVEQLMIRNEELKNFSYSTSHDLKQPLQTILSFVSLFEEKKASKLDEEGLLYLNFIQEAGTRLNQLIDALLAHSILGQIQNFEEVNSSTLVRAVISDLKAFIQSQEGEVTLGGLPTLIANKEELGAVFQNLITNALKFRKAEVSPLINIWAEDAGSHWKFVVRDNGKGIEEHLQEKIFQMFQVGHTQREIKGTGIGLANCKKIINLHGGEIWVNSEYGKGSSFFFTVKKLKAKS